jgi:DNA (cytosine-5)-methyltransferase 1
MAKKCETEKVVQTHTPRRHEDHDSRAHGLAKRKMSLAEEETPYGVRTIRFIDLFCGIGGFHLAMQQAAKERGLKAQGVFASDIDSECQVAYEENFGLSVTGDITKLAAEDVPDHDVLLAGFPCQPFSIIGARKGFSDTRGTLFFDIARILKEKKPAAFVLENVKMLKGHDGGRTLKTIIATLNELGYRTNYAVLNALEFGLPQKRERIWIVGNRMDIPMSLPIGDLPMKPLSQILEKTVDQKHQASSYIKQRRMAVMKPQKEPTIWHENKAGNISAYPYSCALRAGASYNYLLVDGKRRLTPREMLRLQGFPDTHKIVSTDSQTRKQAGNSLPVNVAQAVIKELFHSLQWGRSETRQTAQPMLLSLETRYETKAKTKNR